MVNYFVPSSTSRLPWSSCSRSSSFFVLIVLFNCLLIVSAFLPFPDAKSSSDQCFCKLNGDVDDCECKVETLDAFNNYKVHPRVRSLVQKNYFRYIQLNLNKICKFWSDDAKCSLKDCHVKVCTEDDLPASFRNFAESDLNDLSPSDCEQSNPLGHLNNTLTEAQLKVFEDWKKFDDAQDNFCEPDDENLTNSNYIDLLTNPERFTGYKGPHAHKIWNSIYRENCFAEERKPSYGPEVETCLEKRVFHRLISGLHASINIHLCALYLHKGVLDQADIWAPNVDEFVRRFDPATTNGQGPQWLKNLYFIYLVELRALTKAAPYLENEIYFTGLGNSKEDDDTKLAVLDFLKTITSFENQFDETLLFKGNSDEAAQLKEQFKMKFRNITRIMDCVGCDKCRLWGKIQTKALGTALKILFSGKSFGLDSTLSANDKSTFQLTRNEIVSLFNGFARLSHSIANIEYFREQLKKGHGGERRVNLEL